MKKFTLTMLLIAMLAFMVACDSTNNKQTAQNDQPMLTAINTEQSEQIAKITEEFRNIADNRSSVLIAAKTGSATDGFCVQYDRNRRLNKLMEDLTAIGGNKALYSEMSGASETLKAEITNTAYASMKNGQSISCGYNERAIVEEMAKMMDSGKSQSGTSAYDPKFIRAAYLRAIKLDVQSAIADLKEYNNSDVEGGVINIAEDAKLWGLTPSDIGIPEPIQKRLGL